MRLRRLLAPLVVLVAVPASAASAGTAVLPQDGSLPWSDPAHRGALEQLASRVATRIAGRAVTVRCEGADDWRTLAGQQAIDPARELGFVGVQVLVRDGAVAGAPQVETYAEISPQVCQTLQAFGQAVVKPTTCRRQVVVVTRSGAARIAPTGPQVPCYQHGAAVARMPSGYWDAYANDAQAILTVAHESVHLSGVVGGTVDDGLPYGDPGAEAKAECYGMQWMPWVAQQLGADAADAQAIAQFMWQRMYPNRRSEAPAYWSPDCKPGGALDLGGGGPWR